VIETAWPITILVAGIAALLLWRAARPLPAAKVDAWARRFGLSLDEDERFRVTANLRRSRWWRTIGGTIPWLATFLAAVWAPVLTDRPLPDPLPLTWLLVPAGYLTAAMLAEATMPRPRPEVVRAAALTPRELPGYLPGWVPRALRAAALAVIALTTVVLLVPFRANQGWSRDPSSTLVDAAIALVVVVAVEIVLRRIVALPQPAVSPRAVALDGALRSSSVRTIAGAGLALLLHLLAGRFPRLIGADLPGALWVALACFILFEGLAIASWRELARSGRAPEPVP
jgi:hypothetical protein